MRAPVREAFSYGIRHWIRHIHCDSMSYDQIRVKPWETINRIILRIPQYGVWYSAECMQWNAKKISCKSLQKSIEAMVMKEKRLPQITLSYLIKTVNNHTIWLKLWIKEENGVHKVTINLTSHHTGRVTIHFVCEAVAYEIEDAYCRTGEDTAYDTVR